MYVTINDNNNNTLSKMSHIMCWRKFNWYSEQWQRQWQRERQRRRQLQRLRNLTAQLSDFDCNNWQLVNGVCD